LAASKGECPSSQPDQLSNGNASWPAQYAHSGQSLEPTPRWPGQRARCVSYPRRAGVVARRPSERRSVMSHTRRVSRLFTIMRGGWEMTSLRKFLVVAAVALTTVGLAARVGSAAANLTTSLLWNDPPAFPGCLGTNVGATPIGSIKVEMVDRNG